MQKYFITTDSTADLPQEFRGYDMFYIFPMEYMMGGKSYYLNTENVLSTAEFYTRMTAGDYPNTSQITPFAFEEKWRELLQEGNDILHISFSSALSGTYNNAISVANTLSGEFPDRQLIVIDSISESGGEALLVSYALSNRETMSIQENRDNLEQLKYNVCHYFTVNNLFHLNRGGRVSKFAAIVGTALQLKPLLNSNDLGELVPLDKCMGRKAALSWLVRNTIEKIDLEHNKYIFLNDGNCPADADFVEARFHEHFPDIKVYRWDIGPVIGAHCGEGVIAIFFISKNGR